MLLERGEVRGFAAASRFAEAALKDARFYFIN